MSGQTKMIIITTNEDIIKKFQLNQNQHTQIFDLDNNQMDLSFLNQNSNFEQISKRSLELFDNDEQQIKSLKNAKKSDDFICRICGDRAIGYNYDALSCASCKAFFRRNANQNSMKLRCLTGNGSCSVAFDIRRKCAKCRLRKCFSVGMRKDFILSEEEKQRRKSRLELNRYETSQRLAIKSYLNETSFEKNQDLLSIENIRNKFINIFQSESSKSCGDSIDLTNRFTALITWSQFASETAVRIINFFRQINQFENLDNDDRFILIKYNLLVVFPLSKCFHYKPTNDCCALDSSEQAEKHRQFFALCGETTNIRETFIDLIVSLVEITKQDPTILSLFLTVLIFSPCLSMSENEPPLKDPLAVHQAQSYHIELLWNYLLNEWDQQQTHIYFIQLINLILKLQIVSKRIRDFFRDQCQSLDFLDQIAPLMQSVLHIN